MPRTLLLALLLTGASLAQPLTPEDFVKLNSISQGTVSPDGKTLIYTVSSDTPAEPHFDRAGEGSQNKICLFEPGTDRVLLENAMQPSWSPDGKALALLDTDINEARLKVWWKDNDHWSILRHAAIGYGGGQGYCWLNSQRILVATATPGKDKSDVNVLDSLTIKPQPRQVLVEWNPDTGTTREWAKGVFTSFQPDPEGTRVAALRWAEVTFPSSARSGPPAQLVLLDGSEKVVAVEPVSNPRPESLRWSADGTQLVARDEFGHWWQIRAESGAAEALPNEVQDCCWVGNQLALRSDAWRIEGKALMPGSARFFGGGNQVVALSAGHAYRLEPGKEPVATADLPAGDGYLVERASFPVVVRQGDQRSLVFAAGQVRTLPVSAGTYFAGNGDSVWMTNPEHTRITGTDGQAGPSVVMPNSGDRLTSLAADNGQVDWLLLPAGDKPGPYPTVVWLEPGRIYSPDQAPKEALLSNQSGGLNARLLSSHGYAVYFPSLASGKGEPAGNLDKALQSGLRRLAAQGQIDMQRLAVMGQGYGGYATLLAATQSHPFKAAVACSAFGDLSSDYARLSPATRLGAAQDALPFVHRQSHDYERGQLGLGQPPWQDPQLYVRNSPYYQVGRVQTPVLLITGTQDGHLAQSEQFFAALYRQGKPARLVRYQNEDARIDQADHVVDEWHQILGWLERYIGEQVTSSR
ncbi:MAG: prolyl oligopeptidase family serine peptidase [Vulcanimicrobiota bacterium]